VTTITERVTEFHPRWRGKVGIFGGFVLARFADAARVVPEFAPLSLTIQFVSALYPGDAEVTTEVLHRGGQTASVRMEARQGDRLRAHAVAILAPVGREQVWGRRLDLSEVPAPDRCALYASHIDGLHYADHLEMRTPVPATLESGASAWIRLRIAAEELDLGSPQAVASVFLDALQPGLFAGDPQPVFVPTIDFTAHFSPALAVGADGWHYAINETVWSDGRYCVEESTLCTPDGLIVAQVRQSRAIRWPAAEPTAEPAAAPAAEAAG
jgi:acyl-CoA thioesterase